VFKLKENYALNMGKDNDQLIFGVIFDLLTLNQSHRQLNVSLKDLRRRRRKCHRFSPNCTIGVELWYTNYQYYGFMTV